MPKTAERFSEIVGQSSVADRFRAFADLFCSKERTHGSIFVAGEDGSGKETLAICLANELKVRFDQVDAATIKAQGDLTALLTNLREGQVFLMSNIHRLGKEHIDKLVQVMREGELEITIGTGPAARRHIMEVHPFILIATAPRRLDCPPQLQTEFPSLLEMLPYSIVQLTEIAESIARKSGCTLHAGAAEQIARSSNGTPGHVAARLNQIIRALNNRVIVLDDVQHVFHALGIRTSGSVSSQLASDIDTVSGADFERAIASLLSRMGFTPETTKASGDGGIDIVAFLDKPIVGGKYIFQCKRFAENSLVGAPDVRDFFGAVKADGAVKGVFITTSKFTPQAREFGEKAGVELIDGPALRKLMAQYE